MSMLNPKLSSHARLHDIDYFIRFFEYIEKDMIGMSTDKPSSDAWEWLREDEADDLYDIIKPFGLLIEVNDGMNNWEEIGKTPQERVCNFLQWVQRQNEEYRG